MIAPVVHALLLVDPVANGVPPPFDGRICNGELNLQLLLRRMFDVISTASTTWGPREEGEGL